jgi:hypothetical protein
MRFKVIECHVKSIEKEDDYLLSVAVETAEEIKFYQRRCGRFDDASAQLTAKTGKKLKPEEAAAIFPQLIQISA